MSIWMVCAVLMLVIACRFYFPTSVLPIRRQFFQQYVRLMNDLLFSQFHESPLVWSAFVAVPPILLAGVVVSLSDWIVFGNFFLCGVILWYSLDCRFDSNGSPEKLISDRLCFLFGPIVWFILLGVVGVVVYVVFYELLQTRGGNKEACQLIEVVMSYLNWIPVRVLGISVALVGYFSSAFTVWRKGVWQRPSVSQCFLQQCGMSALGDVRSFSESKGSEMALLLRRVLVLWLMLFCIFIFFHWVFLF